MILTELQPHQKRVVELIKKYPGLLLHHSMGSGKTLSSIAAADSTGLPTKAVMPASLIANFKKELLKHLDDQSKFSTYSIQGIARNPDKLPEGGLLIVDEAHNIRNPNSAAYNAIKNKQFEKKILLTGTPIYNTPEDLKSLIKLLGSNYKYDRFAPKDKSQYPRVIEKIIKVKSNPRQEAINKFYADKNEITLKRLLKRMPEEYSIVKPISLLGENLLETVGNLKDEELRNKMIEDLGKPPKGYTYNVPVPNYYLAKTRQAANSLKDYYVSSNVPKIKKIVEDIKNRPGKTLVYSNYLGSGLKLIEDRLNKLKIPYGVFTGEISKKQKKDVVDKFNKDVIPVLLVSSSGTEGLDLKGTRQVLITEPHWNMPKIDQVIGRAVRYKSHADLPEDKRKVLIKKYISILNNKDVPTADEVLMNLAKEKNTLGNLFLNKKTAY